MRAIELIAPKKLELHEVPEPAAPGPGEVLLAVESVGVCGSDVHYYNDGRVGDQIITFPYAIGHECSATVLAIGNAVTRVKVGDRVAIEPAVSCGACDQCRAGRRHTCRALQFLGTPGQLAGCLRERLVMPERCCLPLAPRTTLDQGALVEPLSIAVYAAQLGAPRPGQRIAILGAGPIGLALLLCLRHAGHARIYVTEPLAYRREKAEQLGAIQTLDPRAADCVQVWQSDEPLGFDLVFECCGQQTAVDEALRLLKPGGTLVLVGIPTVERLTFDIAVARRKEITIRNVRRQNECAAAAVDLIERGDVPMQQLQTHTFPFARSAEAFDLVAHYRDGVIKAMIHVR
jgi:L-iditol 2-dehydrogenase